MIDALQDYTYRMIVMGMMGTIAQSTIGNPAYNTCANIGEIRDEARICRIVLLHSSSIHRQFASVFFFATM